MEKRGKDMRKLRRVIVLLLEERVLAPNLRDHPLKGEWKSWRDLHIEADWVLIYKADEAMLRLERTGTHADLFKE